MYGIVTIVEQEAAGQVHELRSLLSATYGADSVKYSNVPHLSYHVADEYDVNAVRSLLERVAAQSAAFTVPTLGLGFVERVVFLNLARTPMLSEIHRSLWNDATKLGTNAVMRYHPDAWFPHVTLAEHDTILDHAGVLASAFRDSKVPHEVWISNLALIEETASGHEVVFQVQLPVEPEG